MEQTDLALVVAIRDTASLTRAAAKLQLSAPVVTKRLAALEAHLGVKLFFRTTRQVAATAEGELLCEHAVALLAGFQQAEEALREQSSEPTGLVRLVATLGFGRLWLGPALADFQTRYPKVRVAVQLTETLPDLAAQGVDAAVWLWAIKPNKAAQWSAKCLAPNQRVLVAAPSYLQVYGSPATLAELAQHNCLIVRESDDRHDAWQLSDDFSGAATTAVVVRGPLSSNSGELVRDWCVAGRGIMLRSLWDVAPLLASGQLLRVLPNYAMRDADIHWLAPYRPQTPLRVRLLRDFLAERFRHQPWL